MRRFSANRRSLDTFVSGHVDCSYINRIDVAVSALVWSHKGDYGYDALHHLGDDGKTREKSYVCVNCGKGYAVKRSLWRHRKFECINPATKFTCDLCPYESPYKWRVDLHSRKHDQQSGYNQYYNAH